MDLKYLTPNDRFVSEANEEAAIACAKAHAKSIGFSDVDVWPKLPSLRRNAWRAAADAAIKTRVAQLQKALDEANKVNPLPEPLERQEGVPIQSPWDEIKGIKGFSGDAKERDRSKIGE